MNQTLFTGSATAMVTPFSGGEIDFPALGRLIDRQLEGKTDALVVCGTTGEPPTLTQAEKDSILAFALERVNGRIPVFMGTGTNCTSVSVRQSLRAQQMGADGLLVVTPYYNRCTQSGLIAHYTAIADAVGLPIILYCVPSRTGVNLLPETAARLSEHENICGVKEASGDISQIAETARLCGERIALYSGNDDQILPVLSLGGQGVISVASNVVPRFVHDLTEAWFSGRPDRCRELQLTLLPLAKQLFSEVNPIPVKAALEMMGLCRADVRLPLTRLSPDKWKPLENELNQLA